jgi:putative transport protein
MDWFRELIFGSGVAHSILLLSIVIALGILMGKIKIGGVALGITFVLFVGIVFAHFGFLMNEHILHFFKEFGLILFVYSVGMQVGPGFFSSFRKGGVTLNMLATGVVLLGVGTMLVIHYITGTPLPTMVGILSGAVTNTPSLGAAQQAYSDVTGSSAPGIALGYAVAYPLGVVGIILAIMSVRFIFKINLKKEAEDSERDNEALAHGAIAVSLKVKNPAIFGKKISELAALLEHNEFVISRILYASNNRMTLVDADTVLNENDKIFVITTEHDVNTVRTFIGEEIDMNRKQWVRAESQFVNRRIIITKSEINGKQLGDLQLRKLYGITITRINRAGVDLVAAHGLVLQLGDRVNVVGTETSIASVEAVLGNSMKRLNEPNLIPIFLGIALGILLGSIPFQFPGIPQPVKLGLAGGPLIVAILISRFGYKWKLVTYTTQSANLMLRETGITIFLACVGLGAGGEFVKTIVNEGGYAWIGYGFLITIIPTVIIGLIARKLCRLNYFTIMGLIAGSTTDPPALAYSNATAGNDMPSVSYATVYPLTMFLRVLTAQILILSMISCAKSAPDNIPIINKVLHDTNSLFYTDFSNYPSNRAALPIGVFDSGTGGLTVLEKILVCDEYNNVTGEPKPDGKPDFANEKFNYLGDIANMPYGNYAAENKSDYLRELVIRDATFLLKEQPSKIIVIACNTATAYGLNDIASMLSQSKSGIKVIGVINAGVKATLMPLDRNADYAIGIMATPGTIASGAYERTVNEMKTTFGFNGAVKVVNQAGKGFAEAVDGEKDFTDPSQTTVRNSYRGPVCGKGSGDINLSLMDVYNFDRSDNALLTSFKEDTVIQLNSAGNYARFHLVSLLEQHRQTGTSTPLQRIILGCTHYPFLLDTLKKVITEVRNSFDSPYKALLADDLEFIDPALFTAKECYETLFDARQLSSSNEIADVKAYFSTPSSSLPSNCLNADGSLTYEFKYGRTPGKEETTTLFVPFSDQIISRDILDRLQMLVPKSYELME